MARASGRVLLLLLLAPWAAVQAATVKTEVSGVEDALLANVRASLSLVQAEGLDDLSIWRLRRMAEAARDEAEQALKPFGYYRPGVRVRLIEPEGDRTHWRATIDIDPGPAVTVDEVDIELSGEGRDDPELAAWRRGWPLAPGERLDHRRWRSAWQRLEQLAEERGYFEAEFIARRVVVDAERARADIDLRFDTGPRYRFGDYTVAEPYFDADLMARLHVLEAGEPYSVDAIDRQRGVLVRSALFERVVVEPERDEGDHRVDLNYRLDRREPNTWRATIGFGTDTGARIQLGWTRHYLSSTGNRLELGFGAQERNEEFVFQGDYRHPYGGRPSEFLTAGTVLRSEQDDFRFFDEDRVEPVFDAFDGRREQAELSLGILRERDLWRDRYQPLEERLFVTVLDESFDAFREASLSPENEALLAANPELIPFLQTDNQTLAFGARWRLARIEGTGFDSRGAVWRLELLGAHETLGSDVGFAQASLDGRWHLRFGQRHKLLLRGQLGYTEAETRRLDIELGDRRLELNLTDLPERYRFKTGGDRTVRGYGFEDLSTNRNGGNNLIVGSVEYEYRVGERWSLATFADIGNAFNDVTEPELKRGWGVGFRWYTMIGPLQIDFAQALDADDKPWRLHFTIGTRLL